MRRNYTSDTSGCNISHTINGCCAHEVTTLFDMCDYTVDIDCGDCSNPLQCDQVNQPPGSFLEFAIAGYACFRPVARRLVRHATGYFCALKSLAGLATSEARSLWWACCPLFEA